MVEHIQDQEDQLVLSLSALTSVSVTQTNGTETLTTGNGTPLVVGFAELCVAEQHRHQWYAAGPRSERHQYHGLVE